MHPVERCALDPGFIVFARFAVTAFFAIVFLQSGLNKVFDSEGNLGFIREHFAGAPMLASNAMPAPRAIFLVSRCSAISSPKVSPPSVSTGPMS